MEYSIREAAEAAGVSKSTIQRRIKSGDMSKNANGKIDPSELARIYPDSVAYSSEHSHEHGQTVPLGQREHSSGTPENDAEISVLRVKLQAAEQLVEDRGKTIDHLRDELAEEKRERRETQTKLTALLTDQRETTPAPSKKPVNYPLWALVIGLFGVVIWVLLGQGG